MAGTVFIERKSHTAIEVMKKLVGEITRKKVQKCFTFLIILVETGEQNLQ